MTKVRIGTRRSKLAMTQTQWVAGKLREAHPEIEIEIVPILTQGDRDQKNSITDLGGKSVWTKEIQKSLLELQVDLAVHSLKDLATSPVPGLRVCAFPERVDPRDVWIARDGELSFQDLNRSHTVGTSALRRQSQLMAKVPGVSVRPIRGNVDTRLGKLREGDLDGILLAAAGLKRLGLGGVATEFLEPNQMLPAPGQGALALETREGQAWQDLLMPLHHESTKRQVLAERAFQAELEGNCQLPLGALAEVDGESLHLRGVLAMPDGKKIVSLSATGRADSPEVVGEDLAKKVRAEGGHEILEAIL